MSFRLTFCVLVSLTLSIAACGDDVRRGSVGESCRARNDCGSGLVCIRDVCVRDGSSLPITGKACVRVECSVAADCCTDYVPDGSCASLEADCQANPNNCLPYRTYCQCNRGCEDDLCVDTSPECIVDDHCLGIDEPYCAGERCVACRNEADCGGAGDQCVDGECIAACSRDEECPLLSTCTNGVCTETGCSSDRECAFLLGTSAAVCDDGRCEVSCDSDLECRTDRFEACSSGRCVFAGCSTDVECRAYLDLENEPSNVRAECR